MMAWKWVMHRLIAIPIPTSMIERGQVLTQHHDYELASYHKPNTTKDEESTSKHANFDNGNIVWYSS